MREAVPTPPTMRSEPGRPSSPVKPPLSPRAAVGTESQQLWNSLRGKVYDQMPHGGNDLALSYRLMPMVINGAPALGLCGSF